MDALYETFPDHSFPPIKPAAPVDTEPVQLELDLRIDPG